MIASGIPDVLANAFTHSQCHFLGVIQRMETPFCP